MNRRGFLSVALAFGVCPKNAFGQVRPSGTATETWQSQFAGTSIAFTPDWHDVSTSIKGQLDMLALDLVGTPQSDSGMALFKIRAKSPDTDPDSYIEALPADFPSKTWGYAPGNVILDRGSAGTTGWVTTGILNETDFPDHPRLGIFQFVDAENPHFVEVQLSLHSEMHMRKGLSDLQLNGHTLVAQLEEDDLITRLQFKPE